MSKRSGGAVKLGGEAPPAVEHSTKAPVHETRALGQRVLYAGRPLITVPWPARRQATPDEIHAAVRT